MSDILRATSDRDGRILLDAFRAWVQVIPLGQDRYELFVQSGHIQPGTGEGRSLLERELDAINATWRDHITIA